MSRVITRVATSLAVGVAALTVGGGAARQAAAQSVIVPNVVGMRGLAAEQTLQRAGLQWRWDDGPAPSPSNGLFLTDRIYGQTFVGERVKPRTTILLTPASRKIVTLTDLP